MKRPFLTLAIAASVALAFAPQSSSAKSAKKAKDPSCVSGGWSLKAGEPGPKSIIDVDKDLTWIVTAARVSNGSTVLLEYKLLNGVKGELAMQSGTTQLVEAANVSVELQNAAGATASGSFRCE